METQRDIWRVIGNIFPLRENKMFILLEMDRALMKMDIFGLWEELMMS